MNQPNKLASLVGTWERDNSGNPQLKMYTDTHFAWVVYEADTGKTLSGGGGTYTFDGETLKEKVIFSSYPDLNGSEQTLNVESLGTDSFRLWGTAGDGHAIDETFARAKL